MESTVKVHLNICEHAKGVEINRKHYPSGFRGPIETPTKVLPNDMLEIEVPGKGVKVKVGGAKDITDVSIRMCEDKTSVIAIYKDPKKNMYGCCVCGPCGVCVYGDYGCDPGCP